MRTNLSTRLKQIRQTILKPQPKLSLSEWADKYRYLSSVASAEPGIWRTSRTPYLKEIMDTITEPGIQDITLMLPAQYGKSEVLFNTVGYYIHNDPCPVMYLCPTSDLASTVSKTRIAPMIKDSPALTDLVSPAKSRDSSNTVSNKLFAGGSLSILSANSASNLASRPIRILLLDEIDRMSLDVSNEGSAVELAKKRTTTFYNRKIIACSTPTVKDVSQIERLYEQGSQATYHIECVHCEETFKPKWKDVQWSMNEDVLDKSSVLLHCPHCGSGHTDAERLRASSKGIWIHKHPDRDHKSFHSTTLVSPWVRLFELVEDWIAAKHSKELLQTFINTVLAETWEESSDGIDNIDYLSRREDYDENTLPQEIELVTAGIDTQDDRLEASFYGWTEKDESYFIKHEVIHGDPSQISTWNELSDVLQQKFTRVDGAKLKSLASCIDSGGHHTEKVYQFAKANRQKRWWSIKGRSNFQGNLPIFPKRASKSAKYNALLYTIGVDSAKSLIYSWLKNLTPGPGYVHFNYEADEDFFDQLTAERLKKKFRNGFAYTVWVLPKNKRNEALDCFVYALAAKTGLNTSFKRLQKINLKSINEQEASPKPEVEIEPTTEKVTDSEEVINTINNLNNGVEAVTPSPKRHRRQRRPRGSGYISSLG